MKFPFANYSGKKDGDLNNILTSGFYGINGNTSNSPISASEGLLIVFNCTNSANGGNPIVQILVDSSTSTSCYIRIKWVESWRNWIKL